ncbi:hypothetical protein DFJ74DRAFT_209021 [Hyaloraphidium curvatum]|nr:hypothetical protein DFJ74DRAFT_209021 [Hyaloraphidium curvatum]
MAAATAAAGAAAGASTPLIAHGFGANPGMDPPVPPDAAPSILLSAVYFAAVTLPAQLVRFAALLLRLAFSLILFLGTLLSPLASLLSHALMPLLGLVSPRHISLSLSFDLAWLVRWATYASLATAIFYTWRYVWGGRYSRLPPTDPKVLKFQPDKLAPGSKPEAAPAEAEDSDLEDDPEHQLRALADLLSGIKVFKYLDPRVFFELLKSFSTRTVEAGETIIPEGRDGAEGDLIVVINGEVELFLSDPTENVDPASTGWATPNPGFGTLRKSRTTESALGAADPFPDALAGPEEAPRTGRERRTLLKLVRRGGTVTSLLGILAVFASEAEEPLAGLGVEDFETQIPLASPDPVPRANGHVPEGDQPDGRSPPQAPGRFPTPSHPPSPPSAATPPPAVAIKRLLPNLSAVAKTPAALAVLPASAFLRMSPEAKQSLVHVILARFSRSAGRVMRGYLGLEEGAWGVVR